MSITIYTGTDKHVYNDIVQGQLFSVAVPGVGNGRHAVMLNKNETLAAMQTRVQRKVNGLLKQVRHARARARTR